MVQVIVLAVCSIVPKFCIVLCLPNIIILDPHNEFFHLIPSVDIISRLLIISVEQFSLFTSIRKQCASPKCAFHKQLSMWSMWVGFCNISPSRKAGLEAILQEQELTTTAVFASDCQGKWFHGWWLPSFWNVSGECTKAAGGQRRSLLWRNSCSQEDYGGKLQWRSSTHHPGSLPNLKVNSGMGRATFIYLLSRHSATIAYCKQSGNESIMPTTEWTLNCLHARRYSVMAWFCLLFSVMDCNVAFVKLFSLLPKSFWQGQGNPGRVCWVIHVTSMIV